MLSVESLMQRSWPKQLSLFLLLMLALTMIATPADAKRRKKRSKWKTITYRIKKGDTLSEVAKKHKVKVSQLRRWNKGTKTLKIGRKLRIVVPRAYRTHSNSVARQSVIRRKGFVPGRMTTHKESAVVDERPFAHLEVAKTPASPKAPSAERSPRPAAIDAEDKNKVIEHTVRKGENVGSIALKYNADYQRVMEVNKLTTLTPEPGSKIQVVIDAPPPKPKGPMPVVYRVRKGDSFGRIAKKHGTTVSKLKKWNSKVNPRKLQPGKTLRLYVAHSGSGHPQSVGSPNRGRLYNGVGMETTKGIRVRKVTHAYGTPLTVNLLGAAGADVKARWPETPHLVVGDISYQRGGRIKRHKSHQSGRDVDVSFYHKGDVQLPDFRPMHEANFDAAKNWHIFKTLIDTGYVQYIFIDYPLQKVLHDYALSIGYSKDDLAPLIQYPQPRSGSHGIIRHIRGHDDHFHIRFKCGPKAVRCRD